MGENPRRNIWDLIDVVKKDVTGDNLEKSGSEAEGDEARKQCQEAVTSPCTPSPRQRAATRQLQTRSKKKPGVKSKLGTRVSNRRKKQNQSSEASDNSDPSPAATMEKSSTLHRPWVIPDLSNLKSTLSAVSCKRQAMNQLTTSPHENGKPVDKASPNPNTTESADSGPVPHPEDVPLDLSNSKRKVEATRSAETDLPEVPLDLSVKKSVTLPSSSSSSSRAAPLFTTLLPGRNILVSPAKSGSALMGSGAITKDRVSGLFESILGNKQVKRVSPVRPHVYGKPVNHGSATSSPAAAAIRSLHGHEPDKNASHLQGNLGDARHSSVGFGPQGSLHSIGASPTTSPVNSMTVCATTSAISDSIAANPVLKVPAAQAIVHYTSSAPLRLNIPGDTLVLPKPVPMAQVRPNNSAIQTLSPSQSYSAPITTTTISTAYCVLHHSAQSTLDVNSRTISSAQPSPKTDGLPNTTIHSVSNPPDQRDDAGSKTVTIHLSNQCRNKTQDSPNDAMHPNNVTEASCALDSVADSGISPSISVSTSRTFSSDSGSFKPIVNSSSVCSPGAGTLDISASAEPKSQQTQWKSFTISNACIHPKSQTSPIVQKVDTTSTSTVHTTEEISVHSKLDRPKCIKEFGSLSSAFAKKPDSRDETLPTPSVGDSQSEVKLDPKLGAFIPIASSSRHILADTNFFSNIAYEYQRSRVSQKLENVSRLCSELGQVTEARPSLRELTWLKSPKPSENVLRSGLFDFEPVTNDTWKDHLKEYKTEKLRMPQSLVYVPKATPARFALPDNTSCKPGSKSFSFIKENAEVPANVDGAFWKSKDDISAELPPSTKEKSVVTKADLRSLINARKALKQAAKQNKSLANKSSVNPKKLKAKSNVGFYDKNGSDEVQKKTGPNPKLQQAWLSQYQSYSGDRELFNPCGQTGFDFQTQTLSETDVHTALDALIWDNPPELEKMTYTPPKATYDFVHAPVLSPKRVKTPPRIPKSPYRYQQLIFDDPPCEPLPTLLSYEKSKSASPMKPKRARQVAKKSTGGRPRKLQKTAVFQFADINIVTIGEPVLIPITDVTVNSVILLDSSEEDTVSAGSGAVPNLDDEETRCSSDDGYRMWDEEDPLVGDYDDGYLDNIHNASHDGTPASSFHCSADGSRSIPDTTPDSLSSIGAQQDSVTRFTASKRNESTNQTSSGRRKRSRLTMRKRHPNSVTPRPRHEIPPSSPGRNYCPNSPRRLASLLHQSTQLPQRSPGVFGSPRRRFQPSPALTSTPRAAQRTNSMSSSSSSSDRSRARKRRSILDELANSDGYVAEKRTKQGDNLLVDPTQLDREQRALQRAIMQFSEMEVKQLVKGTHPRHNFAMRRGQTCTTWRANQLKRKALMAPSKRRAKGFVDYTPEILSSRTRHGDLRKTGRDGKPPVQSTPTVQTCPPRPSTSTVTKNAAVSPIGHAQPVSVRPTVQKVKVKSDCIKSPHISVTTTGPAIDNKQSRVMMAEKGRKKVSRTPGKRSKTKLMPPGVLRTVPCAEVYMASVDADGNHGDQHLHQLVLVPRDPPVDDDTRSIASTATSSSRDFRGHVPSLVKRIALCHNTGETVLHKAARLGYEEVCLWCCQSGYVDPDAPDNAGYTALHESAVYGHTRIAKYLLAHGVQVNVVSRLDGVRPLLDAVQNEHMEVARLLLSMGADPNLTTYSGKNAFSLARSEKMKQFLSGYQLDLNGPSSSSQAVEDFPWEFSPFHQKWPDESDDNMEEGEELGFDVLAIVPPDEDDDCNGLEFEFFDDKPIDTFSLCVDSSLGRQNFVILSELLGVLGVTREVLFSQYCELQLREISVEEFLKQLSVLERASGDAVVRGCETDAVDIVLMTPYLSSLLGGECAILKGDCLSVLPMVTSTRVPASGVSDWYPAGSTSCSLLLPPSVENTIHRGSGYDGGRWSEPGKGIQGKVGNAESRSFDGVENWIIINDPCCSTSGNTGDASRAQSPKNKTPKKRKQKSKTTSSPSSSVSHSSPPIDDPSFNIEGPYSSENGQISPLYENAPVSVTRAQSDGVDWRSKNINTACSMPSNTINSASVTVAPVGIHDDALSSPLPQNRSCDFAPRGRITIPTCGAPTINSTHSCASLPEGYLMNHPESSSRGLQITQVCSLTGPPGEYDDQPSSSASQSKQ